MEWIVDYLRRSIQSAISYILTIIIISLKEKVGSTSFSIADTLLSLYFRFCGLSPISIHLDDDDDDDHTTLLHFWAGPRNSKRPNLVMIHGKCGDSRWQFMYQVGNLSRKFELYIPDLLFFGKSYTSSEERSEIYQAKCVAAGLNRLGVDRYSVYGISYGGYVGYHLAYMVAEKVDKVVLMSTGVGCSNLDKQEMVRKLGMDPKHLLVPSTPSHLRQLFVRSIYRGGYINFVPDSFLQAYLNALSINNRKEKMELVDHLLGNNNNNSADESLPVLDQETLLIWGDKDNVFPLNLAYQLQRHLGSKARVAIVKDTGHAVNMDAPTEVNTLISSFILGVAHTHCT